MGPEYHYSRPADVEEQYLTPTDVKQFVFCPRVTYFTRVARLKPLMGAQQEEAKKKHDRLSRLEHRRKSLLKAKLPIPVDGKTHNLPLLSERLRLHGIVDMLALTPSHEWIPVEFKDMSDNRGKPLIDHKYQLAALALLVEENLKTVVRRGIIHYAKSESTVLVTITENMKRRTKKILGSIAHLLEGEELPPPRRYCSKTQVGCGFAECCQGL